MQLLIANISIAFLRLIFGIDSFFVRSLFVLCSFFVRHLFVICSSFVRHLFVICSSFVRLLFVFCSSFVRLFSICPCGSHRHLFVIPSSHFSVTTLPLLGRGLGRGYFVRLLFVLAPNSLQFSTLFPSSKTFSHFISLLLILKFANFLTFYLLPK